jgi:hypothetical protein
LRTILVGIAGSRATRYLLAAATGRAAYGIFDTIFRFAPLSPGPRKAIEAFDTVNEITWQAHEGGLSIRKTVDAIMKNTTYQAEMLVPWCDIMLTRAEANNDDYGRRLYPALKDAYKKQFYDSTGTVYKDANRTTLEYWQHIIWGGVEIGEAAGAKDERKQRATRKIRETR